ncbi:uncharacterized protein LOC105683224 [Athalia rosae]|uniref:uncharacterized protein LOC105683224 n=1 Tax=Athalia rosae TaxID=37344 RepID=UPI0020345E54|nr:uncharacterized protein LOC105683224 [Athalia rosae]
MSCFVPEDVPLVSKTDSGRWPGVWPCKERDSSPEALKGKRKFGQPCTEVDSENASASGEPEDDFASHIELWHARIPPECPSERSNPPMIDRAIGLNSSLVSGDYILTETVSKKKGNRVYATACLRGLVGMHIAELDALRARVKTWKWCFYQAIIALLVKTQLRYKHAWSGNIDYIYERGWNLFTHIGNINVKTVGSQKFDQVGAYNYTYDIEVELVQEMKDIPRTADVAWDYVESNHGRVIEVERKDLLKLEGKMGSEKETDRQTAPVHKTTKDIEKWFDKLPFQYQNCILRTNRYSLAFWKDGLFWYLYNPYRCNKLGFWDNTGYACIVKFCSRNALKRHLMILLLRANVYKIPEAELKNNEPPQTNENTEEDAVADIPAEAEESSKEESKPDVYTLQIFQVNYKKCELQNARLLKRQAPKPMMRPVSTKEMEACPYDPMDSSDKDEEIDNVENPGWLKRFKVTWVRCPNSKKRIVKESVVTGKLRWHQFYVEEPYKLFSLWGDIHPTQSLFPVKNRGKQAYACYVICAGMTRITAPEYWSSKTLDAIVMCGDKYYTFSAMEAEFNAKKPEYAGVVNWERYLSKNFQIGETMFQGSLLPGISGRLYTKSRNSLWATLRNMFIEHPFGIVTCESTCVCVFKFCGAFYMCDVHSTGPPLFQYGGGAAYLIRTTCFTKFMVVLTLTISSSECSEFVVNPIKIANAIDVGPVARCSRNLQKMTGYRVSKKIGKVTCPYDHSRKSAGKKPGRKATKQKRRATNRDVCNGEESPCEAAGYLEPPT